MNLSDKIQDKIQDAQIYVDVMLPFWEIQARAHRPYAIAILVAFGLSKLAEAF